MIVNQSSFLQLLFFCLDAVSLVEAVNSSGSINKLLLSSIEWMAGRTDFNVDVFNS